MRLLLLAPFCLSLCLLAEEPKPLPEGVSLDILVQEVQGEVDVRPSAKEKWVPAAKGMKLPPGAKLCTGVGSGVAVSFGTNSVALVSECTVCEIRTFEMRGEELVASIHLDPGVAKVNVKQLAQFHTDFQVSTPRLTCSVRGSEALVIGNGDNVADVGMNNEGDVGVDGTDLAPGEQTNSDGESNQDLALKENVADTTPDGATDNEQDPEQVANNAGNIDLNASDATLNTDPSPSGGDNSTNVEAPPPDGCDPAQVAADEQFLNEHGLTALVFFLQTGDSGHLTPAQDDFDSINFQQNEDPIFQEKRAAILRLIDCSEFGPQLQDNQGLNFPVEHILLHALVSELHLDQHAFHGIDLDRHDQDHIDLTAVHNTAHSDGMAAMSTFLVDGLKNLFFDELNLNTGLTQAERDARIADYISATTVGETAFQTTLNQLVAETSGGAATGFDAQAYGEALIGLLHLGSHIAIAGNPPGFSPGGYDFQEQGVHNNGVDPLLGTLGSDGVHAMVTEKASTLHQYWHDQTGLPQIINDGETGFDAHQALHGAMDEFLDAGTQGADASNEPR